MRRIYRPFWEWEDFQAGMWNRVGAKLRAELLHKAIEFTGDAQRYGSYMQRVVREWPRACEHNLTEPSMNRLAWIGHAATCLAIECPEDITRAAWAHLSDAQRNAADAQAQAALDWWITNHDAQADRQLPLCLEA